MLTATRVAFLGLGMMGLPMALNLVRHGFDVVGYNRTAAKGEPMKAAGGSLAATPAEAVAGADFVITMLTDPAAVAAVATGEHGFLKACRPGTIWLECSTIGPTAAREFAAAAADQGVTFLDAPVLGSIQPATDGTLTFVVGGDAEAVVRATPVMEAMGKKVLHMGGVGMGAAAKVISNAVTAALVAAVGEGLALGERMGLDREALAGLLENGPVSSPIVKLKLPLMVQEDYSPAFLLKLMEKDLGLALHEAHRLGAALPVISGTHTEYGGARAAGMGELDFAAVAKFVREMAKGPVKR